MRTFLGLVGQIGRIFGAQSHFTIYGLGLTVHVPLESSGAYRPPGARVQNPGPTRRRKMRPVWSPLSSAAH